MVVPNNNKFKITFRPYSDANFDRLKQDILNLDWNELLNFSHDVNIMYNKFNSKIDELYCKNFPTKVKYVSIKRIMNPWLSAEIKKIYKSKM